MNNSSNEELIDLGFLDDIAETVNNTVNQLTAPTPAPTPGPEPVNERPLLEEVEQVPKKRIDKKAKEVPNDLRSFYAARAKNPSLYSYDGRGNLVIREENGSIKTTLALPKYRKLSPEELEDLEEKRRRNIEEIEDEYVKVSNELHQLIDDYNNGRKLQYQLKDAQLRMADIDMRRTMAYYPKYEARTVTKLVKMKDIFQEALGAFGDRTVQFPIYKSSMAQHDPANYWVRAMTEDEEANEEALASQKAEETTRIGNGDEPGIRAVNRGLEPLVSEPDKNLIILFNRPEDDVKWGVFANDYPIEFNWRGIKYFTVDQALGAEKARFFGKAEDIAEIMRTRSAVTMRSIARKIGEAPSEGGTLMAPKAGELQQRPIVETDAEKAAREKRTEEWTIDRFRILKSILLSKFRQHPYLADILKSTGDATLARADHRDMEDGIGIAITDPRCEQMAMWRGKNMLGKALMEVRTDLRLATTIGEDVESGVKTENTISAEDEADASKAKAVMTIRRRRTAASNSAIPNPTSMAPLTQ
jgi:predicted NAD-dependent protein-ADP-ribosyltransferase YbiA (DUF1768 family)